MDREKLFRYLKSPYLSKREMIARFPLGVDPDELWRELLQRRKSQSTSLPLYSCTGTPYWYVTTDRMIAASEKIVEALTENEIEFDPYADAVTVLTLEEVFYTSYVEGSQITMQAAMDFLTGDQPPRDIEEQMIANNRNAGAFASENLCRRIDANLMGELVYVLTEGMDNADGQFRQTDEVDYAASNDERFDFPAARIVPGLVDDLCAFLSSQDAHPLIKASIAQCYTLIVRPFPEGNERLSRILANIILLRAGYTFFGDVSLSALIARKGYAYYEAVANVMRKENGGDLTYFIEYFLDLLSRAVDERKLRMQRREEQNLRTETETARLILRPVDESTAVQPSADFSEDAEQDLPTNSEKGADAHKRHNRNI